MIQEIKSNILRGLIIMFFIIILTGLIVHFERNSIQKASGALGHINNQAAASYKDSKGNLYSSQSNLVSVVVSTSSQAQGEPGGVYPENSPEKEGSGGLNGGAVSSSNETSVKQLEELINLLLAQVEILRQKIAEATGATYQTIPSNFSFQKDLVYRNSGEDVTYLQIFLMQQGPDIYPINYTTGYFGKITYESVKRFQEKYKEEVLLPAKVSYATGKVGFFTRQKINQMISGQ